MKDLLGPRLSKISAEHTIISQSPHSSFASTGPIIWNGIPQYVKEAQTLNSFKSMLKTFLFTVSYWQIIMCST